MKQALLSHSDLPFRQKKSEKRRGRRILVIAGPTGSGKTQLGLSLAQVAGGEIVSSDSCQIYRGMDIGTAKATPEERSIVAHHLIDLCGLDQLYNVAEFCRDAKKSFEEIISRENIPIVVGGSGFYIHALLYGPPHGPPSSPQLRQQLEKQMQELGADVLYERLQMLDSDYAATISERDRHKIIRALEIMTLSEKRVSDFPKPNQLQEQDYDFRCWFIYYPRERLYSRVEMRCDEMLHKGFLEEVRDLEKKGLRNNSSASQAIGYRQALAYLESGQTAHDFEIFVTQFKRASRHYVKRQFTWFRKEPLFRWLNCDEYGPERLKEIILQDFEQND